MAILLTRDDDCMTTPGSPESGDDLLTTEQALKVLGFSQMTLERRVRAGMIRPVNHNPALLRPKVRYWRRADVERLARGEPPEQPPAEG